MKILHLDNNHPLLIETLERAGHRNTENYTASKTEIQKILPEFEGIVIRSRFLIDKEFLEAGENLKFIARVGAGLESIDQVAAKAKNIKLIAAPEGNSNAVGEHTLALLLSLLNNLNIADAEIKNGQWKREANRGTELDGKTVGIIGYGNMGKAFAKKLRGFDCSVLFYDIKDNIADENATQVSLKTLQAETDILSLHAPLTPLTNKMVDKEFIEKFQKPFWFLNTARGKSVVTADLVEALKNKKILGAGLDVLEYEKTSFESLYDAEEFPMALKELLSFSNVILSPHIAGWTVESKAKLAKTIAEKIIQNFGGFNKNEFEENQNP